LLLGVTGCSTGPLLFEAREFSFWQGKYLDGCDARDEADREAVLKAVDARSDELLARLGSLDPPEHYRQAQLGRIAVLSKRVYGPEDPGMRELVTPSWRALRGVDHAELRRALHDDG
jgi:hypothetical protein